MILGFKTSIQREADRFFKELLMQDFNIRSVSKGAFGKARSKLNPEVFKRLNEIACKGFYEGAPFHQCVILLSSLALLEMTKEGQMYIVFI